jgi:adenosylcobinamide-GDP ribazoletransferase
MSTDSNQAPPSEIALAIAEMRMAAIFLTRLPARIIGHDTALAPDFRQGARVFPAVGAVIGAVGGVILVVAAWLGMPALVAAALAIGSTVLLTGGLHEDGLADMADSFGGATTEKKLEIMDDSRVGTYGALALVFSVLVRVCAVAAIVAAVGAFRAALALIAAEAVSRAALVRLWHDLPAARMGGLAGDTGPPDQNAMLIAIAVAAVVVVVFGVPSIGLWPTILGALLATVATYAMIRLTARALGGRTGDTLGACQQAALAAFLVGASVA